jgi:hypothetical protein
VTMTDLLHFYFSGKDGGSGWSMGLVNISLVH